MDVRVKLLLQGGHVWDFCCEADDPVVFGLVSALPGANVASNLPADGLVQVETRTGERLFLTRSSLVSVEVAPVGDPMQVLGLRQTIAPSTAAPGTSVPAPFLLASDVLPGEVHAQLTKEALEQVSQPLRSASGGRVIDLGPLATPVGEALRACAALGSTVLNLTTVAEDEFHLECLALGDAQALAWSRNEADLLHVVCHLHALPKALTGGGIRLFDTRTTSATGRDIANFRDVTIDYNEALIFPASVVSSGLPVRCASRAYKNGLFALHGTLRKSHSK